MGKQECLRPRDRFWDIPVPKIDSAFDNLLVPQPSWSPSTTQQLRKLVAAPYLAPNDWTPRLDAYFASPLALCARRVSSAASRLLGSTSLRFALHGWQRMRTQGFTLVELLMTVTVLGILTALAVPSFRGMMDRNAVTT
ncbi:prepilin-type N-terminal cleavage/methylation domain-containing protein, partial [Thiolapillus sp.]|uniref:pilus assembly FimT family protein n=1 Tax=Thiolapillus sp. TaxID=2017437 RepID=UPI0025DF5B07